MRREKEEFESGEGQTVKNMAKKEGNGGKVIRNATKVE